jgi:ATP-dependent protease ClpP protease subunit
VITIIGEIDATAFRRYLNDAEETPTESVLISSPGGDIGYTLAMLDDIDFAKRPTIATGICQSAAAVLATAGEGKRVCTMDCLFRFIPPVEEMIDGIMKVPDLRAYLHNTLVCRLAARLKVEKVEAYQLFDGEFITSVRAKELGLIDEVISTEAPSGDSNRLRGSKGSVNCSDSAFGGCWNDNISY